MAWQIFWGVPGQSGTQLQADAVPLYNGLDITLAQPQRLHLMSVSDIMFTPARDFLLETPWRIIIPNPNVNSHSL
jgi:hypothetical protein